MLTAYLVLGVKGCVEGVHHHHDLVGRGTTASRIDDERAVQSLVNVSLQRNRVAVIEMQAKRVGVELIHERVARLHLLAGKRAVHVGWMPPVKMDRMWVRAEISERDPDAVAFGGANRGSRHLSVVGPCRKNRPGAISISRSTAKNSCSRSNVPSSRGVSGNTWIARSDPCPKSSSSAKTLMD